MTRAVLYVAHCLAPTREQIAQHKHRIDGAGTPAQIALRANLEHAMRWLSWLRKSFPETTFIAPWIAAILSGEEDADPVQREMGLVDACATLERCDGIVLCGPRISSGMQREMEHGREHCQRGVRDYAVSFAVYDLTTMGGEAPREPAFFDRKSTEPVFDKDFGRWITAGCHVWERSRRRIDE